MSVLGREEDRDEKDIAGLYEAYGYLHTAPFVAFLELGSAQRCRVGLQNLGLNVGREEAQKVLRSRLPRLNERMFLHLWAALYTIKERTDDVFNAASADPLPQHPMISGDIYREALEEALRSFLAIHNEISFRTINARHLQPAIHVRFQGFFAIDPYKGIAKSPNIIQR